MGKGCVIVLGTFDGVHKGHKAVLNSALAFKDFNAVAVTFPEPPKRKTQSAFVPMLMTSEQKNEMLKSMGFSEIMLLDYDEIHTMSPQEFLDMLAEKYDIKAIVCGFNYRFGNGGAGDAAFISSYCNSIGAEAVIVPKTEVSGQVVSSSFIRELIANGDITFANMLLDRPYQFTAEVVHGDERGRTMGFPTINQQLDENLAVPKFGVYASAVSVDGKDYPAVTNIGIRPTFLLKKPMSETYIIDFDGDLYGKNITVKLLSYLRGESRFDGLDDLKAAIENDKETALKAFKAGVINVI